MIRYSSDEGIASKAKDIVLKLGMDHIDLERLRCVRSKGSKAKRTIARCHAMSRVWQESLGLKAHYIIEVISENFDNLSDSDKDKVIIHELLHIPFSMGGGFKHHKNYVTRKRVERLYKAYIQKKAKL